MLQEGVEEEMELVADLGRGGREEGLVSGLGALRAGGRAGSCDPICRSCARLDGACARWARATASGLRVRLRCAFRVSVRSSRPSLHFFCAFNIRVE
jgi:hypothetical protein